MMKLINKLWWDWTDKLKCKNEYDDDVMLWNDV